MSVNLTKFNVQGEKVGTLKTDSLLFSEKIDAGVVHRAYVSLTSSRRQGGANTKNRGEVRGGGKKPWKQKGTGRARHGSIRSPLWVGGGVTFGPTKNQNFERKVNKREMRKAIRMVLTDRAANDHLAVITDWETAGKTKGFVVLLKGVRPVGKSTLVITPKKEGITYRAGRNIPRVKVLPANEINLAEILEHQYLVVHEKTLAVLEKLFAKK